MARRALERDQPDDSWGRPPGHPMYGVQPVDTGPTPYGTPLSPAPVAPGEEPAPAPAPTPTPAPTNPGFQPFAGSFSPPSMQPFPDLPQLPPIPTPNLPPIPGPPPPFQYADYEGAQPFTYDDWRAPSVEQAMQDPGYQFRVGQGVGALQRWAAAKGTLNDSGTAKALIDYGQNAGSQEYANVWNRDFNAYQTNRRGALDTHNVNEGNRFNAYKTNRQGAVDTYNTNYQTQYVDPYKASYQAALDTYEPQQEAWNTQADFLRTGYLTNAQNVQRTNEMNYSNSWERFLNEWERWKDQRDTGIDLMDR